MPATTARWWSARSWRRTPTPYGFDAQTGEYGDLVSKGIVDPTKVVRTALQSRPPSRDLLITIEAMIADLHEG